MRQPTPLDRRQFIGATTALMAFQSSALAKYPDRPVRMLIPFAAGGATDVLGRDLGQAMTQSLGQSFVIENLGGGAGVPALTTIVRSAPDGYTTFFAASGNITAQPLLAKKPVDILSQVAPVGMIATAPHVLVINSKLPYKNVAELIAYAKANPGALNFGSAGIGGLAHLGTELFARSAGIKITHVPYKGAATAMNDLVAGQIQAIFGSMPSFTAMLERGSVRAIGLSDASKSRPMQGIPLISATVPGFAYSSWNALFVPAKTPEPIIEQLFAALKKASIEPGLAKRFDEQGVNIAVSGPAELRALIQKESAMWAKVIKDAKIELN